MDAHSNFGYSTITVAPVPANSGTSLTVAAGQGALFPAAPFNCTVWPPSVQPLASNAEIVRVTAVVGDTLTITRAQEGTSAKNIEVGWQIANTTSVKVFTDIEDTMLQFVAAGGVSATAPGVVFNNANGITFGAVGNTITASHNGITQQSTQPVAFSASNGSFLFSTLQFADGNGVTFGTGPGGIVTASVAPGGAASINFSAGTTSNNLTAITFADANGITFGLNAGTMTASHNGITSQSNQAASASNGSFTFQTLNFSNANNVTFGTSAGGIITASVNAGGAGITLSGFSNATAALSASFSASNGVATVFPVQLPVAIAFDRFIWKGSQTTAGNITGTGSSTVEFGIYTKNVSTLSQITNFSSTGTFSYNGAANISSNFQGIRNNVLTFAASTLPAGDYFFVFMVSRTNSSQALFPGVMLANINPTGGFSGEFNAISNVTNQLWFGLGCYNTAAPAVGLPASIGIASISGQASQFLRVPAIELINGTV